MAFQATYPNMDAVPEALREHYRVGTDGKAHAEFSTDKGRSTVTAVLQKRTQLLSENKAKDAQLEAWKQAAGDLPPEKVAELRQGKGGESAEDFQRRLDKALAELRAKEVEPLRIRVEAAEGKVTKYEHNGALRDTLRKAGVLDERLTAAEALAFPSTKLAEGKVVPIDAEGDPSITDLETWAGTTFREAHPYLFGNTAGGGTGSTATSSAAGGKGTTTKAAAQQPAKQVNASELRDNSTFLAMVDELASGAVKVTAD